MINSGEIKGFILQGVGIEGGRGILITIKLYWYWYKQYVGCSFKRQNTNSYL